MTDTQPLSEQQSLHYFVAPQEINPVTRQPIESGAFIKADPTYEGSWPAGSPLLIPAETPPGSIVVSVAKNSQGKTVAQAFEVFTTQDGNLAVRPSYSSQALKIASDELDTLGLTPSDAEARLATMRTLKPGNPVTAENRTSTHVQLLPTHPTQQGLKMLMGLITPADFKRYGETHPPQQGALISRINAAKASPAGVTK